MRWEGRKRHSNIDWIMISSAVFLLIAGLLTVYSTSVSQAEDGAVDKEFYMQIVWILLGAALFFIVNSVSYTKYVEWAIPMYGICLCLLLLSLVFPTAKGSRWINLGFFTFQPAEPMKIAVIIAYARFLNLLGDSIQDIRNFFISFLILVPPLAIVAFQPDFGSSLSFPFICFAMIFASGAKIEHIFALFTLAFLGGGIPMIAAYYKGIGETTGWLVTILSNNAILIDIAVITGVISLISFVLWFFSRKRNYLRFASALIIIPIGLFIAVSLNSYLKPYQIKRIVAFIDAEKDPWGTGYNIIQSKIAIGSGGFGGKGFTKGPQNALSFLPENKTDFIYSTLGEEWGFIGSFFLLTAYFIFLYRAVTIARNAKDTLGSLIATGIVAMFAFHIFVNIGMATGVMPVTGLPLPFISYGGSNLLTCIIALALLYNIDTRRYVH